jgi:membrane-associated PAP2 superfamily phosphatase
LVILVYALTGLAAALTAASLAGPNVDLTLTGLFYQPANNDFAAGSQTGFAMLREHGAVAVLSCIVLTALALPLFSRWKLPRVPGRTAVFLTVSLILGPGVIVNAGLKEHWGRPRPGMIVEFGGQHEYVHWWSLRGTCKTNCSFASGEAASAAWMFAPAMIAPLPWRAAAMAGAAIFTVTVSLLRLAAGGHFLTDIVFGVLITLIVLLATYQVTFRTRWPEFGRRSGRPADLGTGSTT